MNITKINYDFFKSKIHPSLRGQTISKCSGVQIGQLAIITCNFGFGSPWNNRSLTMLFLSNSSWSTYLTLTFNSWHDITRKEPLFWGWSVKLSKLLQYICNHICMELIMLKELCNNVYYWVIMGILFAFIVNKIINWWSWVLLNKLNNNLLLLNLFS